MDNMNLTEKEALFCELYICGETEFVGNSLKCYRQVFEDASPNAKLKALHLLSRPDIKEYIQTLEALSNEDAQHMKQFLTSNLMHIVNYCSTTEFVDKKGRTISPAPLRSVAVAASKALMDIHPVKAANRTEFSINSEGNGGITFNVIMPDSNKANTEE